jgi:cytochrome b involved in lipid metabolism
MPTTFTRSEVAQHNTDKDCWVIISDKVYNVTTFLDDHPGGKRAIMMYAGKDATVSVCLPTIPPRVASCSPALW